MADRVGVLSLVPLSSEARAAIEGVAPEVALTMAPAWFDGEIRETWPEYTGRSYVRPGSVGHGTRAERDALLADAEVILAGFPVPLDLRARSPRLRWLHQTPAGASNLRRCDLWGGDVPVTTSRGVGNTLPIAEYVVATFLHFARGLHSAVADERRGEFDRFAYRPITLAGRRVCVVGVGGIGRQVGRLCAALGMRVVGTRRSASAGVGGGGRGGDLPEGFEEVAGPDRLHDLLARSTFVAVCCQWTPETEGLIGREALAALPEGGVVVNVARGELIDEDALAEALDAGRLRGAGLDVYRGEFEHAPPPRLWHDPRVLVTPHVSGGSDRPSQLPVELFCDNLRALLDGRPLRNLVDWDRGY